MDRHIDELLKTIPDLLDRKVLDLGAGRGRFMIALLKRGGKVSGVEPYGKYINIAKEDAKKEGFELDIREGVGESIPFNDSEFSFVNMTEVIEHVEDPEVVMKEVYRVLSVGGKAYVSIPNRFGMKDQHFNLYFVNWLPRSFSNSFISIFGKHKNYNQNNGLQKLDEMHYMTWSESKRLFENIGFNVRDIRELKLDKLSGIKKLLTKIVYLILKPWYFDSFHVLLTK